MHGKGQQDIGSQMLIFLQLCPFYSSYVLGTVLVTDETVYSQGTWIDCFCFSSVLTPNYALTWPPGRAIRMGYQDGPSGWAIWQGRQSGGLSDRL